MSAATTIRDLLEQKAAALAAYDGVPVSPLYAIAAADHLQQELLRERDAFHLALLSPPAPSAPAAGTLAPSTELSSGPELTPPPAAEASPADAAPAAAAPAAEGGAS